MGEYAKYRGHEIKIGTCEDMYYIRYEDKDKVIPIENSLDCSKELGLRWRLPFPDEDDVEPGQYIEHDRGEVLRGFTDASTINDVGLIQVRHEMGLLINLPCYHGEKMPEITGDGVKIFWNGKSPAFALTAIKNTEEGLYPIVSCRFCHTSWRYDWKDVLPYIIESELKYKLEKYQGKNKMIEDNKEV